MDGEALRKAGYRPLPVKRGQKGCMLPGWPDLDWRGRAPGLGISLGGLAMVDIDLDLDDDRIAMKVAELVDPSAPLRSRADSPSRIALLLKCEDLDGERSFRRTTSKWTSGRIEVKGGHAQFMFGWGDHPDGARLFWETEEVSDRPEDMTPRDELPSITLEGLEALVEEADEILLHELGEPDAPGSGRGLREGFETRVDIEPGMVFTTDGGQETTETLAALPPNTSVMVNLTPWRPESDSMAGHARVLPDGVLQITDYVEGVRHIYNDPGEDLDIEDLEVEAITPAIQPSHLRFVRAANGYIWAHDPSEELMSRAALWTDLPTRDRAELLRAVPVVQKTVWDPRKPPLTTLDNPFMGWREHNVYAPPVHPPGGNVTAFLRWLGNVYPNPQYRRYVLQWMAAKVRAPWERGISLCIVGPQGSGKTTLWRILQKLWGPYYARVVGTIQDAYDSTYDNHIYKALYTLFDEVASAEAGRGARDRSAAKNRLKKFTDPGAMSAELNLKYGPKTRAVLAYTVGVTTNNLDALPLDEDDRRWLIVLTGAAHDQSYLYEWMEVPANIGALWRYLEGVSLEGFSFLDAPMTEAKRTMFESNRSVYEEVASDFIEIVTESGGWYEPEQLTEYCHAQRVPERLVAGVLRARHQGRRQVRVGGQRVRAYCLIGDGRADIWSPQMIREALNKTADSVTPEASH